MRTPEQIDREAACESVDLGPQGVEDFEGPARRIEHRERGTRGTTDAQAMERLDPGAGVDDAGASTVKTLVKQARELVDQERALAEGTGLDHCSGNVKGLEPDHEIGPAKTIGGQRSGLMRAQVDTERGTYQDGVSERRRGRQALRAERAYLDRESGDPDPKQCLSKWTPSLVASADKDNLEGCRAERMDGCGLHLPTRVTRSTAQLLATRKEPR